MQVADLAAQVGGARHEHEVRQGKGSEVVAYRPGGRIARIGRHSRNREVPSTLVQRVHQVGVSLAEWVRAVDG